MKYAGIEIHVSDYCNRHCGFCTFKDVKSDRKMSAETAVKVFREWYADSVTFSGGGEPTTNLPVLQMLMDSYTLAGSKCGLTTNGYVTATNELPLEWVRLSVYSPKCVTEVENVLRANARHHNAALFFTGMENLKKYTFLLECFEEVTVKTLNESKRLTDDECKAIRDMGFLCKQNPVANDFGKCLFDKPTIGVDGEVYKCCLCKAQGGFFGVDKCLVPCVMYNSNKQERVIINKFGFPV